MKFMLLLLVLLILYAVTHKMKIHTIYGKIARTEQELNKGLMFRKHALDTKEGMLFVMLPKYDNSVWMKDTYISLDVIFLDSTMKVVGYKTNTTPLSTDTVSLKKPSSYIVEMNAHSVKGLGIHIGDYIQFTES